jgi:hypothetical protein
MRILLLSQIEDGVKANDSANLSVLDHVINGDDRRTSLLARQSGTTYLSLFCINLTQITCRVDACCGSNICRRSAEDPAQDSP